MRTLGFAAGLMAILVVSPASGKTRYETYEARNSVVDGQGGSKTTTNGVDFWTTGDPPRRYQIIGIIRDNRGTGAFFGNAIGSSRIAKKVREVGGDAVILMNQDSSVTAIWSQGQASTFGNQVNSSSLAIPIEERVTKFAVVKYLLDESTATNAPPVVDRKP